MIISQNAFNIFTKSLPNLTSGMVLHKSDDCTKFTGVAQNLPVMLHKFYREMHNLCFHREPFVHKNYLLTRLNYVLSTLIYFLTRMRLKSHPTAKKFLKQKQKSTPFLLIQRGEMNTPCKNRSFAPGGKTVFLGGAL